MFAKKDKARGRKVIYIYMIEACQQCHRTDGLSKCARCRSVQYCSKICQQKDWKRHKHSCVSISELRGQIDAVSSAGDVTFDDLLERQKQWCMARFSVLHHLCRLTLRFWRDPELKSRTRAVLVRIELAKGEVAGGTDAQRLARMFSIECIEDVAADEVARSLGWPSLLDGVEVEEDGYVLPMVVALKMGRFVVPLQVAKRTLDGMPDWMKELSEDAYDQMLEELRVEANEGMDRMGWDDYVE